MIHLKNFLVFSLIVLLQHIDAQPFHHYSPLVAKGSIPDDFRYFGINDTLEELPIAKKFKAQQNRFFQENAFYLQRTLTGGRILYGDTVTQYINQVADILLTQYPDLRKKLRFYAAKSPVVNAFCANNGIVLVNMGLIAKVRNEAELAFILSHEIAHFTAQHPLKLYLKSADMQQATLELLAKNPYSSQLEIEADSMGLQLFMTSPYKHEAAISAFDLLKYSAQNIADLPWNFKQLETPLFQIPDSFFVKNLFQDSSFWEKSSTHPDPEMRAAHLQTQIPSVSAKNLLFKLPENQFAYIQKIARYENCIYWLDNRNYEKALYHADILGNIYQEDSDFLAYIKAYSLYALCKYGNAGKFWEVHQDYSVVGAEMSRLCYFTEQYEGIPLTLLSIHYLEKLSEKYPYLVISPLIAGLEKDMGKLYLKPEINPFEDTTDIYYRILGTEDAVFWEEWYENVGEGYALQFNYRPSLTPKQMMKQQQKLAYKGFSLGINRIVFVSPSYQRIDYRRQNSEEFQVSTAMETGLINKLKEYSAAQELEARVLYPTGLKASQTERFNHLAILQDWYREKNNMQELDMHCFRHTEVVNLAQIYETPYFAWIGGVHFIQKKKNTKFPQIISFPFSYISPSYETIFYTIIYDVVKEDFVLVYPRYVRLNDTADVFHSIIYDIIFQIKHKKKTRNRKA